MKLAIVTGATDFIGRHSRSIFWKMDTVYMRYAETVLG